MDRIDQMRGHALTEYAIVAAVILIGVAAVVMLMQDATSADIATLIGAH